MKYAFMTSSCPELEFGEVLAIARQYGYDGVEIRVSNDHRHGLEFSLDAQGRAKAKRQAAEAGIALCCVATSCRFADPATLQDAVRDTHLAIDLASDLGSPCVRIFGGIIGGGLSREAAIRQVVQSMDELKGHAESGGVRLCLETHDDWCDPAHLASVLRQVDHPAVGVNWDLMHPVMTAGKTIEEAFDTLRPWIYHVHFHDGYWEDPETKAKRVMAPIGQGVIDHHRALELLSSINYQGFISGEWIRWKPHADHLPQELALLKSLEPATMRARAEA